MTGQPLAVRGVRHLLRISLPEGLLPLPKNLRRSTALAGAWLIIFPTALIGAVVAWPRNAGFGAIGLSVILAVWLVPVWLLLRRKNSNLS